ncbi:MAG: hypothetical protein R2851_26030 [Caldilineaceae bacterium]
MSAWAGTVHLGGTLDEIAHGERALGTAVIRNARTLVAQQSLFDPTARSPANTSLWAYCSRAQPLHRGHDRRHRGPTRTLHPGLP